jgi:aminoglycoside phosphotransferase (APT) family kinase protein
VGGAGARCARSMDGAPVHRVNGQDGPALERLLRELGRSTERRVVRLLEEAPVKQRPDGRCTVRFRVLVLREGVVSRRTWYGKEHFGAKGARVLRRLRYLRQTLPPGIEIPEPIGYFKPKRLLVTESVEGRFLWELCEDHTGAAPADLSIEDGLGRLGAALAEVHELSLPPDWQESELQWPRHGGPEEARVVHAALERIDGGALPATLARTARKAGSFVLRELAWAERAERVILHRDLHPGQVVFTGHSVGLIDWDEASVGEPEMDLGNLAAHLVLLDLQRSGSIGNATRRIDRLCRAYESARPLRAERMAVHTASTLLRLSSLERLALPGRSTLPWCDLAAALLGAARDCIPAALSIPRG